jgi:hypothetical protein
MDRLERTNDKEAALRAAFAGWQSGVFTALPAIIESFNAAKQTCTATCTVQAQVTDKAGAKSWVTLPKLVDVPVHFPSGGGYTMTFPVAQGDEALIVFSSRCIDNWWLAGGVRSQADLRMHDLSDGFAFVGIRSQVRLLAGGVKPSAQFRSDDGLTYVELAAGSVVNIKAPGGIDLNGVTIDAAGNLVSPTTITAPLVTGTTNVVFGGKSGIGHEHSGVQTGPNNSGPPT